MVIIHDNPIKGHSLLYVELWLILLWCLCLFYHVFYIKHEWNHVTWEQTKSARPPMVVPPPRAMRHLAWKSDPNIRIYKNGCKNMARERSIAQKITLSLGRGEMHFIAVERNNDSDPNIIGRLKKPRNCSVFPSSDPTIKFRLSPIRRFALRYGPPYATYATAASEWRLRNQFCTWVVAPLNPRWRSIQFFFAWQCAKSPCYPVFSWFKYHNVQSFKKVLLLITSYKSRLQVKIPELMTLAGRTCCCQRGVRSSNLTGLDASVSRLIPTVNQTVCWYTIYIYTHPEGPYFDGCIIHPVIIIPIFSWVQSSYSCWNVLISWLKRDIHTYMIYIYTW